MTDRELLELAAKAAGHTTRSDNLDVWIVEDDGSPVERWNPLQDDGQALRLAVNLGLDKKLQHLLQGDAYRTDYFALGAFAATRRAIVRAAAAIGKTRSD